MATRRELDTASSTHSAKFLQARITALSTSCIKRLENIFAAALDEDHSTFQAPPNSNIEKPPPGLTGTAVKQLQLEVETSALIRAAEEFMVLTRTLKELWLFGGLDTIPQGNEHDLEMRRQMEEDEKLVVKGFLDLIAKREVTTGLTANGVHDSEGSNS